MGVEVFMSGFFGEHGWFYDTVYGIASDFYAPNATSWKVVFNKSYRSEIQVSNQTSKTFENDQTPVTRPRCACLNFSELSQRVQYCLTESIGPSDSGYGYDRDCMTDIGDNRPWCYVGPECPNEWGTSRCDGSTKYKKCYNDKDINAKDIIQ